MRVVNGSLSSGRTQSQPRLAPTFYLPVCVCFFASQLFFWHFLGWCFFNGQHIADALFGFNLAGMLNALPFGLHTPLPVVHRMVVVAVAVALFIVAAVAHNLNYEFIYIYINFVDCTLHCARLRFISPLSFRISGANVFVFISFFSFFSLRKVATAKSLE